MLIEFSVKNFRSIKERQTLSMVANSSRELQSTNTMAAPNGKQRLVRSAVVYGPNAAGKSNLLNALQAMEEIVLKSAQQQRGDDLPVIPYFFDSSTQKQPTEFEVMFINEGVRYQYGFTATKQRIIEEWLYAYPKGRAQSWIEREYDGASEQYLWGNSEKLVGPKHIWQESTRDNALFLSTAIQLNNQQLLPVFDWFGAVIRFLLNERIDPGFTVQYYEGLDGEREIVDLLQKADFTIQKIEIQREKVGEEDIPAGLSAPARAELMEKLKNVDRIDAQAIHIGSDGQAYHLDMGEESDGTLKFFSLAGPWLDILENGWIIVVDELNSSLHPALVEYLVRMFHNPQLNKKNAQLIFTTHETAILRQEVFRRDQIWFVDKDKHNATTLYPLSDFSPRKGVENLEKWYLQGRYGALPYLREFEPKAGDAHV